MRIRQADIDDGPRLWALRLEMLADAPLAYLDTIDRAVSRGWREYRHRVHAWVTAPDRTLFVAERDGALVGHLVAVDERGYTGLVMVYLTPSARGQGACQQALNAEHGRFFADKGSFSSGVPLRRAPQAMPQG